MATLLGAVKGKKEDTLESLTDNFLKQWDLQKKIGYGRERQLSSAQSKLIKFILKNKLMTIDEMAQYIARLTNNK
jgi:transposase